MKKQFVTSLQDGDVINDYYIAARKDLRDTQRGGKFLGLVFKDKTGEIGGVLWNNAASIAQLFELGDVVDVRGTVNTYQNRLQVRVDQVLPLKDGDFDPADLVQSASNSDEILEKFKATLATITDPHLKQLTQLFLMDDELMEQFCNAAAGKKWHHAYAGGLLRHCWEMSEIALTMAKLFPNINRDLLLTGILVHDIGKIEEMTQGLFVEYTTAGKLVGHLQIGCQMVVKRIEQLPEFPEDLKLHIMHLILSHHGEMEFGSPVVPKSLEAIVLYMIDNLDAQANAFERIVEATKGQGEQWSEYIGMISRQIWTNEM